MLFRLSPLLLFCLALPARAQVADSVALRGVEVTAQRSQAVERTAQVTRIDAHQIEGTGAQSLADALEAHSSAFARRYGPAGLATISLRGTSAGQTAVLLDGFPIANPQLGQVDGALVPAFAVERVDVMSGAGSVRHGSQAVGGVVNVTPRMARGRQVAAQGEAGAWGERTMRLRASAGTVLVALEHAAGDGDFGYVLQRPDGDQRLQRDGAAFARTSVLAMAARGATRGGILASTSARDLPGTAGSAPQGQRQDDASLNAWARHVRPFAGGVAGLGAMAGWADLRYRSPGLDIDDTGSTRTAYAEATYARPIAWGSADAGASVQHAVATHPSLARDASEATGSAWASVALNRGKLLVAPSARVDLRSDGTRSATPRLGLAFDLNRGLTLRASASGAFRAPTLNDRFWRPGGNPGLRAERGWSVDGGAQYTRGDWEMDASVYRHYLRDQIVWQPGASGVWSPSNVSRTRTLGLDLSGAWSPAPARFVRAGFAITDARDRSSASSAWGERLRFVPLAQARLHVGARLAGFEIDALGVAIGKRPVTADGSQSLPGFATIDVGVRRAWTIADARLTSFARLHNALDARYRLIEGYPMPGRHARVGLSLALGDAR